MPANKRSTAARAAEPKHQKQDEEQPWPSAAPSQAELASAFAQGIDLAEGHRPGHAARVCYIATNLAQAMGLSTEVRRAVSYASLLHDAGTVSTAAEICRLINVSEEAIFYSGPERPPEQLALEIAPNDTEVVVKLLRAHPEQGAQVARDLNCDATVQEAIASHHERWDGHGYPQSLKGEAIPIVGRLVATADVIEFLISGEDNALVARRNLLAELGEHDGLTLDPELVQKTRELVGSDAFWLGIYRGDLSQVVAATFPEEPPGVDRSPAHLYTFAKVFAGLADSKGDNTKHHNQRTADLADHLAEALGFSAGRRSMLRIAALLHNVGLLGVPARVIAKPDILSLKEMEAMRKHPTYSEMILGALPGMEEAARWVGAHHERPDAKGYPEMWEAEMIPIEARIIAVADTYVALTSTRPYRGALSDKDARQVLRGGAGTQLDAKVVKLLCSLSPTATSFRTAPRSRRKR